MCERGDVQDVVKLLDFGLVQVDLPTVERGTAEARAQSETAAAHPQSGRRTAVSSVGEASMTQIGMLLGTPAYMAPEQVCGEAADARSDIYSLGGVACFLLTGKPPFERPTLEELCAAHIADPVPSLRARNPQIPAELEAIIMRCLAKERSARQSSAAELGAALAATAASSEWDSARADAWWRAHATVQSAEPEPPPARPDGFADTMLGG